MYPFNLRNVYLIMFCSDTFNCSEKNIFYLNFKPLAFWINGAVLILPDVKPSLNQLEETPLSVSCVGSDPDLEYNASLKARRALLCE